MRKPSVRIQSATQVLPWIIYLMGGEIPQRELAARRKAKSAGYVSSQRKFRSFKR